jgi:biopolymer transport protein ExbD
MGADLSSGDSDAGAPISAINVTPFVDVVLVLLVIFMITAPALMKDVIGIQLPKASSADTKAPESLGLAVTRQGQFLLNGNPVSPEALTEEVKKELAKNPQIQAIISADREAQHGDVVKAIDLIKNAGLQRFAFQIQRQE